MANEAEAALLVFRKQVFLGYSIAGFVVALIYLWSLVDSPVDALPNHVVVVFICVMILFVWAGAAIARDLTSADDAAGPHLHVQGLLKDLPFGLMSLVGIGVLTWLLSWADVPRLIAVPAIGYGWYMRRRVTGGQG